VLEEAGLVSRPKEPQPRPARLETEVFDQMEAWIERYRLRSEHRYRLDTVLAAMGTTDHRESGAKLERMIADGPV
jgi:hypothetical protein